MSLYECFCLISMLGIFVGIIILYMVVRYKPSQNQKTITLICCAALVVNFGNYFSLFSSDYYGLLHASQLQHVGHIFLLTAFILFMAGYCDIEIPYYLRAFLYLLNFVSVLFCLTARINNEFYKSIQFVENPEPTSAFGTKALGEPPACSGAPAIRNAILNATGVALNQTPMTPHVLFRRFTEEGLIND